MPDQRGEFCLTLYLPMHRHRQAFNASDQVHSQHGVGKELLEASINDSAEGLRIFRRSRTSVIRASNAVVKLCSRAPRAEPSLTVNLVCAPPLHCGLRRSACTIKGTLPQPPRRVPLLRERWAQLVARDSSIACSCATSTARSTAIAEVTANAQDASMSAPETITAR